jgi:hypothetical protein
MKKIESASVIRKRAVLLGTTGLAIMMILTGLWFLLFYTTGDPIRPAGITHQGYVRIRLGMTKSEVEEIIGKPPGEYDGPTRRWHSSWDDECEGSETPPFRSRAWENRDCRIEVGFNLSGRVIYKLYRP